MSRKCIELGASVEKYVVFIAVDRWGRTFGEFGAWGSTPEVDPIVAGVIQELEGMLEAVEMDVIGSCVGL
jgi:hypothetical protein